MSRNKTLISRRKLACCRNGSFGSLVAYWQSASKSNSHNVQYEMIEWQNLFVFSTKYSNVKEILHCLAPPKLRTGEIETGCRTTSAFQWHLYSDQFATESSLILFLLQCLLEKVCQCVMCTGLSPRPRISLFLNPFMTERITLSCTRQWEESHLNHTYTPTKR